ncbi:MRP4 protein, partial [Acromyrmex heyeri]
NTFFSSRYCNRELDILKNLEYVMGKNGQKVPLKKESRPKLYKAVYKTFWLPYFIIGIRCSVVSVMVPILQSWIIKYFISDPNAKHKTSTNEVMIYITFLIITNVIAIMLLQHSVMQSLHVGMRIHIACSSLSGAAMNQTGTGQIMNLLSNDVIRFDQLTMYLNYIWIMPFMVVKMYAWEKPFSQIVSVLTYEMSTYFNILQLVVALYFPQGLILLGESIVSFNRLEDFLLMDEVKLQFKSQKPKEESNAENQIDRYISRNGSIVLSEHQRLSDNIEYSLVIFINLIFKVDFLICFKSKEFRYNNNKSKFNLLLNRITITKRISRLSITNYYFAIVQHSDTDSDYVEKRSRDDGTWASSRVYKEYLHNGGNNFTLFVLLVATTGNDYWLSYWTILEDVRRIENTSDVKQFANMYNDSFLGSIFTLNPDSLLNTMDAIYVYTFCIIACIATTLFRSFLHKIF